MDKNLIEFNSLPKLISIYNHKAAYSVELVNGQEKYNCIFKTHRNGQWKTIVLDKSEVATFVTPLQAKLISQVKGVVPNDTRIISSSTPLALEPLDMQLEKTTGRGYCCDWNYIDLEICNSCVLYNSNLKIAYILDELEINANHLRHFTVEGATIEIDDKVINGPFQLISPRKLGRCPSHCISDRDLKTLAATVWDFDRMKHRREQTI